MQLSGYAYDGYGQWLPHLAHVSRTNQFDIQLQKLKSDSGFEAPRFALEFAIVSYCTEYDGCKNLNITKNKTTSLDDEHTPGIFSVCYSINFIGSSFNIYRNFVKHFVRVVLHIEPN